MNIYKNRKKTFYTQYSASTIIYVSSLVSNIALLSISLPFPVLVWSKSQKCYHFTGIKRDCSPPSSSVHGIFPGRNTGVSYHFLLQGIFPIHGSNPHLLCLPHWQADSLPLHRLRSPADLLTAFNKEHWNSQDQCSSTVTQTLCVTVQHPCGLIV